MRSLLKEAAEIAVSEHRKKRSTLILVPDDRWIQEARGLGKPPRGVFIRSSQNHPGLHAIAVDTLVTVGICNFKGIGLGKSRLTISIAPKWVHVGETLVIKEGKEIWN